jgi:hypothetical protein
VTTVRKGADRRFEQLPPTSVVQGARDRARDVRATAASDNPTIELPDEFVTERDR